MHAKQFLHEMLSPVMHLKRLNTLELLITGLMNDKKLSVTQLGRSLDTKAQEKNNIKCSDRFLGNRLVWAERFYIYKEVALSLIGTNNRPLIIVDWSHVPNTTCYILRAAFAAKGRALTLYEEVFPKRLENNPHVHRRFLKKIKKLLPDMCVPILITDAGFCKPWFKSVKEMGWDYIGRVRGNKCFRINDGKSIWQNYAKYRQSITQRAPEYLGEGALTKEECLNTHFYLTKLPKKYRVSLNKLKKKGHYKSDIEHSKAANEPWLLVTSLKRRAESIIKLYFFRMEIEEGFRDLKSSQFGFSFEHAYSGKIRRIQILLMIAMLAAYILFFIGWIAEELKWHYQFQANTNKKRRVLSLFYLGLRVVKKKLQIICSAIINAIQQLQISLVWRWEVI
jgi:Transposase DDE domain